MPGLLRGIARTAAVAGTASAVHGRVQRRQAEKFAGRDAQIYSDRQQAYQEQAYQQPAAPQQAYAPPVAPPPEEPDMMEQLQKLGDLKDQGILTDAEFTAQKAKILNR